MILDVYSWISMSWSLVNPMATSALTGFPKEMITNLTQIFEPNLPRISFHSWYYFIKFYHITIVSLLISMSRGKMAFFVLKFRIYLKKCYCLGYRN